MKGFLESTLVVGPFACNCRVLVCEKTGHAAVIDPGDEAERIKAHLRSHDIEVKYLLHTHAHLDHCGATSEVASFLKTVHIGLHRDDESLYQELPMQGRLFGMIYNKPTPINMYLEENQVIEIGTLSLRVIHTPGHSPGSVCFELLNQSVCYTGDTLFRGSVGRTDLWGANKTQMFKSIEQKLLTLPKEMRICPGHGSETTIGYEISTNPFLK